MEQDYGIISKVGDMVDRGVVTEAITRIHIWEKLAEWVVYRQTRYIPMVVGDLSFDRLRNGVDFMNTCTPPRTDRVYPISAKFAANGDLQGGRRISLENRFGDEEEMAEHE